MERQSSYCQTGESGLLFFIPVMVLIVKACKNALFADFEKQTHFVQASQVRYTKSQLQ